MNVPFAQARGALPPRLREALDSAGAGDPGTLVHLLPDSIHDYQYFLAELHKEELGEADALEQGTLPMGLRSAARGAAERRKRQLAAEPVEVMVTWARNQRAASAADARERYRAEGSRRAALGPMASRAMGA